MKRIFAFILFLSFILYPLSFSWAAVAFGGCATNTGDGLNTITISNVATSGSDVLLIASTAWVGVPSTTSGVTWNGAPMTLVNEQSISNRTLSLWQRTLGNSPGTHDVVFSFNDAGNKIVVSACYFTGVDQTTPAGSAVTSTDYNGAPISITVPVNGLGFDIAADFNQTPTVGAQTPGAGQTKRFDAWADGGSGNNTAHFGSTRTTTGSFTWTTPGGEFESQIGLPINASVAAPAAVARRRVIGIQ